MRIADIAKKYHISEQAVRGRIKRAGYNLGDLRQPDSAHLSAEGEKVISEIFSRESAAAAAKGSVKGKGSTGNRSPGSADTMAIIRAERDEMKIRAATAETLAAEREKTIAFLQAQIREKDAQISALAAAAGAMRAALPEPEPVKRRKNLFDFFRKKAKKTKES